MRELRKIVTEYFSDSEELDDAIRKSIRVDLVIRDVKQWAKGCVPKEKEYISLENMEGRHNIDGHNQCRAETLKNIEEA